MINCKKSNGNWIVCPSKSNPGKFYYFNVTTGEAVWGDDTDVNTQKKDNNIYKELDNSHVYPEPLNLHEEIQRRNTQKTIFSYNNNINQQNLNKPCPSFGQAMFPQYLPNAPSFMPGVMWAPIQMPFFTTQKEVKPMLDQNTQTSELSNIIIQTCNISLSERFSMLGSNIESEGSRKKTVNSSQHNSCNWWDKRTGNDDNKTKKRQYIKILDSAVLKEPKLKLPVQINKPNDSPLNKNIEIKVNSIQFKENVKDIVEMKKDMLNLDKTDLRHLLILKKQKIDFDVLDSHKKKEENKKLQMVAVKKKVTFNLGTPVNISDISIKNSDSISKNESNNLIKLRPAVLQGYKQKIKSMPIHLLRNLKTQNLNNNWYIITDKDVLVDDINFITDYINGDDICKLIVVKCILEIIESSGRGDGGRPQVLVARQTYRRIVNYNKVEIIDMGKNMTLNDQIINCCLEKNNEDKHIVLITKNTTLMERAKLFKIHAYYLDDITYYHSKEKYNTQTQENQDATKNMFLQTKDDNHPFIFNKNYNIENEIENSNDDRFSNDNNDTTFMNDKQDDKNRKIYIEISNLNRHIQNVDLNNSKDVPRLVNKTYIDSKKENSVNNYGKSFKPLVFQKIFYNKSDTVDENGTEFKNGDDNYYGNERNICHTDKKNKGSVCENFTTSIDNTNNNRCTDKEKTTDKMDFYMKDKNMENNMAIRINEYRCCYVQIMEEFMNIVLERNIFTKKSVPYLFHEGLECLKEFCLDVNIKHIIYTLLSLWKKDDKIKKDITPKDFMRLLDYGWLLIDKLKGSIPDAIKEIDYCYRKLLENIENPVIEDIEFIQTPIRRYQDNINRSNFVKDKSEIVNYLKKHFTEWKNYEMPEQDRDLKNNNNDHDIKILRTSGKHLKSFKIDNKKRITFSNNGDYKNENTLKKNNSTKNGTKFIKNMKIMPQFEETIKKSDVYLDFNETNESSLPIIIHNEVNDSLTNDLKLVNDNKIKDSLNNDLKFVNDNENNDANNDTIDSGFEPEMQTSLFLQDFFVHLSCTFKLIFNFVEKCNNELRYGAIEGRDRECMYEQATHTHEHMDLITKKLISIIERESEEENSELKSVLKKTGQDVSEDTRITRYRQTAITCLEQAQILNSCLKLILNTN